MAITDRPEKWHLDAKEVLGDDIDTPDEENKELSDDEELDDDSESDDDLLDDTEGESEETSDKSDDEPNVN